MILLSYLTALTGTLRARLHEVRGDDRGSFSLEQAVIAAALLALAIGLVAVLVAAVASHESTIK